MEKKDISSIEVGMKEFSQIVNRNGGFGENENLKISLRDDTATFKAQVGKKIVCYVFEKGGMSNCNG
ncbi:MAG TPA: hypothetical protein DDY52_01510 [Candidatus Moranbacteria bacterium]|nr:MAG: hypothetical protein UR51_C0010G0030 [Candidatus Moranbacteria bacterium GW2011_GWF1_34_10]HBI16820.1 hypothetical protein [Candidatus Moranbacteria bacterium]